jgi:outer membrane lipoprotein carrier protein
MLKILLLCSAFVGFSAMASENNHLDRLQKVVDSIHTYSANFKQVQPDEALFEQNLSTGYFKLKRPGRLIWQYQKPDPQRIVVDGKNLWVYDEDLKQVTVRGLGDVQKDFPMSWLLFEKPIADQYTVIYNGIKAGVEWFNLVPKADTFFQSLDVGIKNDEITDVNMYQSIDNITRIHFLNIQKNNALPNSIFHLTPPKGVDVIGVPK